MTGFRLKPIFHRLTTGLPAVVLVTVVAVTAVNAQTSLQGRIVLRSISNDDISTYKLPSDTQRSGGLSTVGLGQPAYLEALVDIGIPASSISGVSWAITAKPDRSAAALVDGPIGLDVPAGAPSDRTVSRVAGRAMLRPDVVGRYEVTAIISATSGATATAKMSITAATYVGISACTKCHANGPASTPWSMANSWSKTLHAEIFKDGMNGVASDHYAASCLGCHTVGYDANPAAANGGFDDVATQLKWTFPTVLKPGVYDALPDALKNVGNIQCENCHGPGSQHATLGGDFRMISVNLEAGDCGQCHGAKNNHFKTAEWQNSMHAVTTQDPSGAGREGCVGCHTAAGFVNRTKGNGKVDTAFTAIGCQTCHDPHGRTAPGNAAHLLRSTTPVTLADGTTVSDAGTGTLCMNCHQSRQNAVSYVASTPGSSHWGPHYGTQGDMLAGVNGYTYGLSIPSSAHGDVVEDTCVHCHMQAVAYPDPAFTNAGGHTFKASWTDTNKTEHDLVAACQECHGKDITSFNFALLDYDGDGVIEGVQTEVQHLLDKLALQLPPVGQPKTALNIDATWTQPQLQAAYNWLFVSSDGSRGVHNTAYAVGLLKTSIARLGGGPK